MNAAPPAIADACPAVCLALLPPPHAGVVAEAPPPLPLTPSALLTRPFFRSRGVTPRAATSAMAELVAAVSLPPRAPSRDTACATTFPVVRRPFCSPFPATATVVAPSPPEQPPVLRLLAQPAGRRPRRAELGSPVGARGPLVPPRHFPRWRRASSGRHREPPTASSALIHVEDFALKFEKREGSFCKVSDSKE